MCGARHARALGEVPTILCADCGPGRDALLQRRYRDEPLVPAATPVHLTPARFGTVDKRYFFTIKDQTVTYPRQLAMASTVTLTRTTSMNTYHCPQVTRAAELTNKLEALMR